MVNSGEVSPARARLALVPLLIGTFTGTVANTVVNVPMAEILADLQVPLAQGALVVIAFNLTFAVLMPLSGWLGDRLGRRRVFGAAMTGLAASSIAASFAPGLGTLVAFRALQGLAVAAVLPAVMSLIATLFPANTRGRALGAWAAANGAGQAAGPVLGGLLAGWLEWRAIFIPIVPLALAACIGVLFLVPRDRGSTVPLGWRGAFLLTMGAGLLLGAASAVPVLGIGAPLVWAGAGTGVVACVAYVLVERGRADAFLPPALILEGRFLRSSLAVIAQMFTFSAALLGVPLYLVADQGVAVAESGLFMLALPLTMAALAPIAGRCMELLGGRTALRAGLVAILTGNVALVALLSAGRGPGPALVVVLMILGAGIAFVQTPAATGATRSSAGALGSGLGLFNFLRFASSALGAAWIALIGDVPGHWWLAYAVCGAVVICGLSTTFLGRDTDHQSPAGDEPSRHSESRVGT